MLQLFKFGSDLCNIAPIFRIVKFLTRNILFASLIKFIFIK